MVSEVPTNELYALVTCELLIFKRVFTLEPFKGVTRKVSNEAGKICQINFSHIVCFKYRLASIMGHFDPKKAYFEFADQPASNIP